MLKFIYTSRPLFTNNTQSQKIPLISSFAENFAQNGVTLVRISAEVMPATLGSSGFILLKKFLWCFGLITWLKMSSDVPQADLHPSSLQVYILWSLSFLGLMNSVMNSSPMAGSPVS